MGKVWVVGWANPETLEWDDPTCCGQSYYRSEEAALAALEGKYRLEIGELFDGWKGEGDWAVEKCEDGVLMLSAPGGRVVVGWPMEVVG